MYLHLTNTAYQEDAQSLITMNKEQERQFALTWVELFASDLAHVGLRSGGYKPKVKGVSASGISVTFTDTLMKKVAFLSKLMTSPAFSPGFRAELTEDDSRPTRWYSLTIVHPPNHVEIWDTLFPDPAPEPNGQKVLTPLRVIDMAYHDPVYRFQLRASGWTENDVIQAVRVKAFDDVTVQFNQVDPTIGTALSGLGLGRGEEAGPSARKRELSNRSTSSGVLSQPASKRFKALDEDEELIAEGVRAYNDLMAEMRSEVAQAKAETTQARVETAQAQALAKEQADHIAERDRAYNDLMEEMAQLKDEVARAQAEPDQPHVETAQAPDETAEAQTRVQELEAEVLQARDETAEAQTRVQELEAEVLQARDETAEAQRRIQAIEAEVLQAVDETAEAQNRVQELEGEVSQAHDETAEAQTRIQEIEAYRRQDQDQIRSLMRESEHSNSISKHSNSESEHSGRRKGNGQRR